MSKELQNKELQELINESIRRVTELMNNLANDGNNKEQHKRAMLLAYWFIDYVKMLKSEKSFLPEELPKYNRGDIVSVNFGFKIGNELGGRHFAVILDNFNSQKSGIVTVAPLTSLKSKYKDCCYTHLLKTGLYDLHKNKFNKIVSDCIKALQTLKDEYPDIVPNRINKISKHITEAEILKKEIEHLKQGTVVQLSQITTISKIRILNPKKASDTLSKIKLMPEDLDIINNKLSYLYLHSKNNKVPDLIQEFKNGLNS